MTNEPTAATAPLRERAESLAGMMSVRGLAPDELASGVDIIFDLLAENQRFADEIERRAAESMRLQNGVSGLVAAIYGVYEQAQTTMRKPSP